MALSARVGPPITEHFSILSSFLNQIEQFLCHWTHKLEGYISDVFSASEVKGETLEEVG
jgi:hypothetical protein